MNDYIKHYSSPVGTISIKATKTHITGLSFADKPGTDSPQLPGVIKRCVRQLDEYFMGRRKTFDLPLKLEGTDFQKTVWGKLGTIPYGQTLSYTEIAQRIRQPRAARAVGHANNKNKIAIILPCHRVIGSDGSMTGYASGVWRKEWLLQHERQSSNS